ncbi:MAG: GAF domain-containing protein [Anaerolineae bacterium]
MRESTILIADDELLSRDLMEALLSQEGYNLAFARNGTEALAKAIELTPDLILLDVMMPGMDGFEICRRLRADPLLATVPIIMITALNDRNSRSQGIEAGADDFISKPFDHAELLARVRTIVRLNRYHLLREQAKFKQLYQATRRVDQLQALYELDQALATSLDPEEVAEITLRRVSAALDAPVGALLVLPSQANAPLEQVLILGQGWIKLEMSEQDAQRLVIFQQRLQQNGRGIIPLSGDELILLSGQHHIADRWGHSGLVAPIWNDTDLIAMLALGGRPADRPFTDDDRALAQAAASRAGQAIQNARLYQASQQQSARLATLHAISTAAVSSLELDTVLHQVLELTCQALNATAGSILMSEPDTGKLIFVLTLSDETTSPRSHHLPPGQGIAGWVAQHGQSVRVNDVRHDPRWYDGVDAVTGLETRSLLCAPLKHRGKITGVIEIINEREGAFTDEDLSLLEASSSIAAAALENARLYTTTRARAAELARLNEVGLALTSTLDFSTIVHAALSQIQRLFQAEHVSLLQPDPQTGELCFVKALVGRTPIEIPVRLPPGEGIVGWVLEQRQPVLVDDVQTDPRSLQWVYQHTHTQARGLMAVPLLAQERVIGVIEVSSSEPGAYTNNELQTLQAVASTLSMALENASLYDELKTLLHEREQVQAQLIHAEKMTALGRLVASIAHEINNPLQAMQTYLTLAQEEIDDDQRPKKINRYLGTVGDEIERIAAIVRRMRDFYRPASKELQPTYLHAVLESVLELVNKQLQHSNVTVERAWSDYLPEIQANPDHLKQVFLNLVLNSIDAMTAGGTLYISTALDQIPTPPGPSASGGPGGAPAVRVEFSDTGEGISPKVLSHLFEPFFTTKERGSGLGLSISYGIIQAHNGQITVESHTGLGTTFTILLPVEQPFNGQSKES